MIVETAQMKVEFLSYTLQGKIWKSIYSNLNI